MQEEYAKVIALLYIESCMIYAVTDIVAYTADLFSHLRFSFRILDESAGVNSQLSEYDCAKKIA